MDDEHNPTYTVVTDDEDGTVKASKTFTIKPISITTLEWKPNGGTYSDIDNKYVYTYDGSYHAPTATATTANVVLKDDTVNVIVTVRYKKATTNSDELESDEFESVKDAGDYIATATSDNNNYEISEGSKSVEFTIEKRNIVLTTGLGNSQGNYSATYSGNAITPLSMSTGNDVGLLAQHNDLLTVKLYRLEENSTKTPTALLNWSNGTLSGISVTDAGLYRVTFVWANSNELNNYTIQLPGEASASTISTTATKDFEFNISPCTVYAYATSTYGNVAPDTVAYYTSANKNQTLSPTLSAMLGWNDLSGLNVTAVGYNAAGYVMAKQGYSISNFNVQGTITVNPKPINITFTDNYNNDNITTPTVNYNENEILSRDIFIIYVKTYNKTDKTVTIAISPNYAPVGGEYKGEETVNHVTLTGTVNNVTLYNYTVKYSPTASTISLKQSVVGIDYDSTSPGFNVVNTIVSNLNVSNDFALLDYFTVEVTDGNDTYSSIAKTTVITIGSTYKVTLSLKDTTTTYRLPNNVYALSFYIKYKTVKIGSTYYTIEDAIKNASGNISLIGIDSSTGLATKFANLSNEDYEILGYNKILPATIDGETQNVSTYTIAKGRKLYLPYKANVTDDWANGGSGNNVGSALYIHSGILLKVGNNENNNSSSGILTVAANYANNAYTALHAVVMNDGYIVADCSSTIYSYGYIKGLGKLIVTGNSTVYEAMSIYDWPGGTNAMSIYGKSCLPITKFGIHNVSCQAKIYAGSLYKAKTNIYASSSNHGAEAAIIGSSASSGMFILKSGYIIKEAYYSGAGTILTSVNGINSTQGVRDKLTLCGEIEDNGLSMNISGIVNISTNTNIYIPLYYMDLIVENEANCTLKKSSYLFRNGSTLTIKQGGTVTVNSGAKMLFVSSDTTNNSHIEVNGSLYILGSTSGVVGRIISNNTGSTVQISSSSTCSITNAIIYESYSNYNVTYKTFTETSKGVNPDDNPETAFVAGNTYKTYERDGKYYWYQVGQSNIKSITVNAYDQNGNTITTIGQTVYLISGSTITKNSLTVTGYEIEEIYTACDDNGELSGKITSMVVTDSFDLYVVYKPITYSITYESIGLSVDDINNLSDNPTSYNVTSGDITLSNPTTDKNGYTFKGWRDAATYQSVTEIDTSSARDITLYATWDFGITLNFEIANNDTGDLPNNEVTIPLSKLLYYNGGNAFNDATNGWAVDWEYQNYKKSLEDIAYGILSGTETESSYSITLYRNQCITFYEVNDDGTMEQVKQLDQITSSTPFPNTTDTGYIMIWFTTDECNSATYYLGGNQYNIQEGTYAFYGRKYYVVTVDDTSYNGDCTNLYIDVTLLSDWTCKTQVKNVIIGANAGLSNLSVNSSKSAITAGYYCYSYSESGTCSTTYTIKYYMYGYDETTYTGAFNNMDLNTLIINKELSDIPARLFSGSTFNTFVYIDSELNGNITYNEVSKEVLNYPGTPEVLAVSSLTGATLKGYLDNVNNMLTEWKNWAGTNSVPGTNSYYRIFGNKERTGLFRYDTENIKTADPMSKAPSQYSEKTQYTSTTITITKNNYDTNKTAFTSKVSVAGLVALANGGNNGGTGSGISGGNSGNGANGGFRNGFMIVLGGAFIIGAIAAYLHIKKLRGKKLTQKLFPESSAAENGAKSGAHGMTRHTSGHAALGAISIVLCVAIALYGIVAKPSASEAATMETHITEVL